MLDSLATAFKDSSGAPPPDVPVEIDFLNISDANHDAMLEAALEHELETIRDEEIEIQARKHTTQNKLLPVRIARIKNLLKGLSDAEAPDFGKQYRAASREADCSILIDPTMVKPTDSAEYLSFSYSKENRGFANRIYLNPNNLDDPDSLALSIFHEEGHGIQVRSCPAAHLHPRNPATRRIMHPADWIRFINLTEREIYAKQGFVAWMINKTNPDMRKKTEFSLVSVDDFENARARYPHLQNALIHCALNALHKPTIKGDYSWTFTNHYDGGALNTYENGMLDRVKENESGLAFVRLREEDFFAIGASGIGPNPLGMDRIDSGFMEPLNMAQNHRRRLDDMCAKYNIPPLDMCPFYNEYGQDTAPPGIREETGFDTLPMSLSL